MIANSTNISNRIFRQQRVIMFIALSCFVVLLMIVGYAGHPSVQTEVLEHYTGTHPGILMWGKPVVKGDQKEKEPKEPDVEVQQGSIV